LARLERKLEQALAKLDEVLAKLDHLQSDVTLLVGEPLDALLMRSRDDVLQRPLPRKPIVPPRDSNDNALVEQLVGFVQSHQIETEHIQAAGESEASLQHVSKATTRGQVLCLIGAPGSGKTVVVDLLQRRLLESGEDSYAIVVASLPSLDQPARDLLPETLRRWYDFPDARIGELKSKARKGECKLIVIADALDETSSDVQEQNLFKSNRLDTWGTDCWPKFILTCRTTHFPQARHSERAFHSRARATDYRRDRFVQEQVQGLLCSDFQLELT
jgi:predicted NACHT family NTPase